MTDNNAAAGPLTEAEAILEACNRSLPVIHFDMQGRVLHANARFLEALGYALDENQGTASRHPPRAGGP